MHAPLVAKQIVANFRPLVSSQTQAKVHLLRDARRSEPNEPPHPAPRAMSESQPLIHTAPTYGAAPVPYGAPPPPVAGYSQFPTEQSGYATAPQFQPADGAVRPGPSAPFPSGQDVQAGTVESTGDW